MGAKASQPIKEQMMTDQQFSEHFSKHEEAEKQMLQGIDKFNNGNLEEALLAFEESSEKNPQSIPTLLYHSLCCFSLLESSARSNLEGIVQPESRKYVQDILSSLGNASNLIRLIR